ncbi:1-acyl-sn-glycerol-3-phosphate acyltransferase [Fibrobacter sp. UWB11]|uniref:lysophospholipid acyltransferase family protein n=1 Tax=Fibrobacter sp. UWB11 TaxID=1896202 RepID=UPI000929CC7A|nr:lysophospholipid acyltransferase family protein [Fibrobacter sp. UWB11]SIO01808.1 1-acyl-sn-glycerol-3-phosphate acyltransferases [Fibrobacter sp. UWB11]
MAKIRYIIRVIAKLFCFAFFGFSSLILAIFLFPVMHLLSGFSEQKFKKMARKFNHRYFKIFVKISIILGIVHLTVENKEALKNIQSKVVIANHPSIFDVVILFSLVPNADCIVKGELIQNKFISLVIKNLYIPNNIPFDEQLEQAKKSMDEGNNLIIFPEGTRSKPNESWEFKKGAARFALYSKNDVIPIFFGGNEKIGLRKHDKLLQFHPTEKYLYKLKVLAPISINEYADMPMTKSATKLTHKMKEILEKELEN